MLNKVGFKDVKGDRQEVAITLDHWKKAEEQNITLRAYLNRAYPTCEKEDTFTQMCASAGLFIKPNANYGIRSTPMSQVFDGVPSKEAAEVSHSNPVQSRILFPAFAMQYVQDAMAVDRSSAVQAFEQMIATTTTVPQYRAEQPVISFGQTGGPEDTRSMVRSELTRPQKMLTITAAERQLAIPELATGIEISDRAMQATTLDLVGLALQRQREVEGYAQVGENMLALLQGDPDIASMTSALSQFTAKSFDDDIVASGKLTHEAWVQWLYKDLNKCRISHVITDIAGAQAIEARSGRPTTYDDQNEDGRYNVASTIIYPNLVKDVKIYIVDPAMSWPANTIMGIDAAYAIARYRSVAASYAEVERFAMRRGTGFMISFGEIMTRLFDDAFKVLSLTVS